MYLINPSIIVFSLTLTMEAILILWLTLMPKLGYWGKTLAEAFTQAPWLDLVVSVLIWIPWLLGTWLSGWLGLVASVVGQIVAMQLWITIHELIHRHEIGGSRIVYFLNQQVGWWRNHLGLWVSTLALPVFLAIRLGELVIYPLLVRILGFPQYKHGDWVNVSRHKFRGLVGHDLIWCLYCDWMTGVYCLGAEMLRNVESFWCPIRFYNGKKCKNCQLDFPDLDAGWVVADGEMDDVVKLMESKYRQRQHSWFGHPDRQSHE